MSFKSKVAKRREDWKKIGVEDDNNQHSNNIMYNEGQYLEYSRFVAMTKVSAQATATTTEYENCGWYKFGDEELKAVVAGRDQVLSELKEREVKVINNSNPICKEANKIVKDAADNTRAKYKRRKPEDIHYMTKYEKPTWRSAFELAGEYCGHHIKPKILSVPMEDGKRSTNNKVHISVIYPHFEAILNARSTKYTRAV